MLFSYQHIFSATALALEGQTLQKAPQGDCGPGPETAPDTAPNQPTTSAVQRYHQEPLQQESTATEIALYYSQETKSS